MSSSDQIKPKWPRETALRVAEKLRAPLALSCERIEIAGSLRRGRDMVGDVELVYVPRVIPDLLGEASEVNEADAVIAGMREFGTLALRRGAGGHTSFGRQIKLMVDVESGVPVDLFASSPEGWFSYLMCRTGSRIHNEAVARECQGRGWKWEPYEGIRKPDGTLQRFASEAEIYEAIGWPLLAPEERDGQALLRRGLIRPQHLA